MIRKIYSCWVFMVLSCVGRAQTNSVLSTGNWFKFSVTYDGVVSIRYDQLRQAGLNPDVIDPRNIQIFTGSPGMLPQANSKARKTDLTEIAILVNGEQDGKFNSTDVILFYAQGPDSYSYDLSKQIFHYQNNLFTDKNFYFLTVGTTPGKRLTSRESANGSFPIINNYTDLAYYETEKYNLLKSGRQWFGEQFDAITSATIRFDVPNILPNSEIKLVSHVMAQSVTPSSFAVAYNNNTILTQPVVAIPNTRYGVKGIVKADTIIVSSSSVGAGNAAAQDIRYQFTKGSPGLSVGYLDFFFLTWKRQLTLSGAQLIFRSPESLEAPMATYEIANATTALEVWDVTDAENAVQQQGNIVAGKFTFAAPSESLKTFCAFNPSQLSNAQFEGKVENQNLRGATAPVLLVLTHSSLLAEANRLASYRQQQLNIATKVVPVDKIYNEFSGGKQDVTAIRDFIRSYYQQTGSALQHVLLFGRGSYDYKNRVFNNTNLVPTYESRNSLSPLETYSSDDYFTFMEVHEGEWFESPAQNHTLDISLGRLPVKTLDEARTVVDKLIEYDAGSSAGPWQNEMLFVADDGDFNIHHSQADQLASFVELSQPAISTRRFFVDSFEQLTRPSGQSSPAAAKALDQAIRKGALIINYTGHGSERVWMDERILDEASISEWKNQPRYPLFVTATCEFGRSDDPLQITSGEQTLLQKKGGSIGLVTSARPVNSSTNFTLNRAFYEALFTKINNRYPDLGTTFRITKNNSTSGVANRNFSLLADPTLQLALPNYQVVFDEVATDEGAAQLKGLSKIEVKGHVENSGTITTNFTGTLLLTAFCQAESRTTRGDENSPFLYSELSNVLYRGQAQVTNGQFETDFILTQNVPPTAATSLITGFAYTSNNLLASGYTTNLVNGINLSATPDVTPPVLRLFMGDTTFVMGGIVGPSTQIVALLSDASGINTTNSPTGKEIYYVLDGGDKVTLNAYYTTNLNTYKKGSLVFPLTNLEKGKHTLSLTASDTYNNTSTVSVTFVVTDGVRIEIEQFANYPNPFEQNTTLEFTHTRPGEDLEVWLSIIDLAGNKIMEQHFEVPQSQYRVTLTDWNGQSAAGTKLGRGIYLGKLSVRSLVDGSKNEQFTKLIILN
ncbi:MAG: type IX secretion system sortase PorU [Cytophagales bacterium]|nr:type IX secretion system sortase PorU [Cytophagales bacterium]